MHKTASDNRNLARDARDLTSAKSSQLIVREERKNRKCKLRRVRMTFRQVRPSERVAAASSASCIYRLP